MNFILVFRASLLPQLHASGLVYFHQTLLAVPELGTFGQMLVRLVGFLSVAGSRAVSNKVRAEVTNANVSIYTAPFKNTNAIARFIKITQFFSPLSCLVFFIFFRHLVGRLNLAGGTV